MSQVGGVRPASIEVVAFRLSVHPARKCDGDISLVGFTNGNRAPPLSGGVPFAVLLDFLN